VTESVGAGLALVVINILDNELFFLELWLALFRLKIPAYVNVFLIAYLCKALAVL